MEWTAVEETSARRQLVAVVDRARANPERDAAWQALLLVIAPHVETWARGSRLLRRSRLANEDDVRAVLVEVLRRLAAHDFEVLRAFTQIVTMLDDDGTPVRAWLLRVLEFAIKDHVRVRLGRSAAGSKRDLGTDADPLDAAPEAGARPPITDLVSMREVLAEISDVVLTFPPPMQRALALWIDDTPFDAIATTLALEHADKARALVRAATARLREKFRDRLV